MRIEGLFYSAELTPLWGRGCVTWTHWSLPDAYKKITPLTSGCVVHPGCMAYMLAQAEADVASACVGLHLKICHLSQMGFYNVLEENVMFSVWGSRGGDYNRYLYTLGAQELTTLNGNVSSNNACYSQQIPDSDKHLSLYLESVCFSFEYGRLSRSNKVKKGNVKGGGGTRHELFLRELSHWLKENKYFSIINQSDLHFSIFF